jgi:hypothetical protein
MNKGNIEEIKGVLNEVCEKGFKIRNILKEKYNHPSEKSQEEILINPDVFQYSLFESFWNLFKIVSDNIENPLILPWVRVIIEQTTNLFWYSQKTETEKRNIACKYWLCTLGFVGGKQGNLTYEGFLNYLDDNEKNEFSALKNEGYPPIKIHTNWYNLLAHVNNKSLIFIEKHFIMLNGESIKASQLIHFYKDMSLYHHPNLIMNNLENEFINKSHIFRCLSLMSICALSLIKFYLEELVKRPEMNFSEEFYRKLNELLMGLHRKGKENETN